ncbi:snRNA-activating protein complex subunit [Anaeramoeba flamelloides]|uniref:snRNA-activating protein complex subunit n=1 Tax=Anaeramoeba flamelloides TaxID=1746091 RepID=A0AAV7ZNB1_9EUKA|nr:snRNA-activating protein complex subunit [Anaeramoeba flamelloides]
MNTTQHKHSFTSNNNNSKLQKKIQQLKRKYKPFPHMSHPKNLKNSIWTANEDDILSRAVRKYDHKNWESIAIYFEDKDSTQCLHRWYKVLNPELKKGKWSDDEDKRLTQMVAKYGSSSWSKIANSIPNRSSKQCRERWKNQLDPKIKREPWSKEEDQILTDLFQKLGPKWSQMRNQLPGRPDNQIKNRWNSTLKRKIEEKDNTNLKPKKKRGRPQGSKNKNKTKNKKGKISKKTLIIKSYGKVIYKSSSVSELKITKKIQSNNNEKEKEQKIINDKHKEKKQANENENEKKLETIHNKQNTQKEKKERKYEKGKKKEMEKNTKSKLSKKKKKLIADIKITNELLTTINTHQKNAVVPDTTPQKLRRSKRIRNRAQESQQYDHNKSTQLPNNSTKLNLRKQQKTKQSPPKNHYTHQKINGIDCCPQKNIVSDLQYCLSNSNRTPTNTPSKFILSLKDNDQQKQTESTTMAPKTIITSSEKRKRRFIEETEDDNELDEFDNQNSIDHFSTPQKIRRVQDTTIYRKPNLNFPNSTRNNAMHNKIKHTPIKGGVYSNPFVCCDPMQYNKKRNFHHKNQKIYFIINEIKNEINNGIHQKTKNENNSNLIQDDHTRFYTRDTNDTHPKKNKKLDDNFFHFISCQAHLNFAKNN